MQMPAFATCIQNAAQSGGQVPCQARAHRIAGGCGDRLRRFPYAVFYTQPGRGISVHAAMHRRRNSRALDDRLKSLELRALPLPMQGAEQRKEPTRRRLVHADLPLQPLDHKPAAFIVQTAPGHVDRLDLARRRGLDRLEIALADQEVVLDDLPEGVEREKKGRVRRVRVTCRYREGKAMLHDREAELVGAGRSGDELECVLLQKVVNRDLALVLDFERIAPDRILVEVNLDQPRRRKGVRFVKHGGCF